MVKTTLKIVMMPALRIFTWVLYFLTLITAYGGYLNPHWWTLPAMGVLFFPYFAMSTIVVSVGWLLYRKFIIGCIGIGVLMACGPTFSQALPLKLSGNAPKSEKTFSMVTFNCLHMEDIKNPDSDSDFNRSLHFLIHCDADFICLQELMNFNPDEIPAKFKPQIDSLMVVYPYVSHDYSREEEFLSKIPFEKIKVHLQDNISYPCIAAYKMNLHGHPLTVLNVHLPSYRLSKKERQIITEAGSKQGMKKSIKELEGPVYSKMKDAFKMRADVSKAIAEYAGEIEGNVVICGDFNDVPGSWAYRNFIKHGFEDAYAQTGFGHIITYNDHLMYFHIDQILFKGELVPLYVKKVRMNASDHYPLKAEFEFIN